MKRKAEARGWSTAVFFRGSKPNAQVLQFSTAEYDVAVVTYAWPFWNEPHRAARTAAQYIDACKRLFANGDRAEYVSLGQRLWELLNVADARMAADKLYALVAIGVVHRASRKATIAVVGDLVAYVRRTDGSVEVINALRDGEIRISGVGYGILGIQLIQELELKAGDSIFLGGCPASLPDGPADAALWEPWNTRVGELPLRAILQVVSDRVDDPKHIDATPVAVYVA